MKLRGLGLSLLLAVWSGLMVAACGGGGVGGNGPLVVKPEGAYRVMTFNVRLSAANDGVNSWANRRELFLKTVKTADPDVLDCQEVLPNQRDFLIESLPGYGYLGHGRDDGKDKGEASPILFRKSRFELVESGQFWLSTTPEVPGKAWDAAFPRVCTWALLKTREEGRKVYVFNTHMDHVGVTARAEGGKLIRRTLAGMVAAHPGTAYIVTGDLNSFEDEPGYVNLTSPAAADGVTLVDAYRKLHAVSGEEKTIHDFKGGTEGRRIDFVFGSTDFVPVTAVIERVHEGAVYPSDHYPVVVDLRWAR